MLSKAQTSRLNEILLQKSKWLNNLSWSFTAQFIIIFLKLGSTFLLSRLLSPTDYGLLGIAIVIVTTTEWLTDIGVVPALLRQPNGCEREWLIVGWWIGLLRGIVLTVALISIAIPLSSWYNNDNIKYVLILISVRPIILALRSPAMPVLKKQFEGKKLLLDELLQTVFGVIITLIALLIDKTIGVWALVAGTLSSACMSVCMSYFLAPMKLFWHWDNFIAKELVHFGKQVVVNTFLMAFFLNSDRILSSKLLSIDKAGIYIMAWNLVAILEGLCTRGLDIYYTVLASKSTPEERILHHKKRSVHILLMVIPLLVISLLLAPLAVHIVYDTRYHTVGPVFAILIARLGLRFTGQLDFQLLLVNGNFKSASLGYLLGAIFQILMLPLFAQWDGTGFAICLFCSTFLVSLMQVSFGTGLHQGIKRFFLTCLIFSFSILLILFLY